MTSEPSTSTEISLEAERSILLQQALSQAGVIRVQKMKAGISLRKRQNSETCMKIAKHPLIPIVELLFLKCEKAANTMNKASFDMEDVKIKSILSNKSIYG
ncbi:unnamed protein product [Caenorhabditis angaria]|uniref:MEIS N-terminal domain-containing protein n=1 Tax=Caenorhabditis angaria TaxID=860376 RepID=A0A9P1J585_9PELO|nr:unnamed protein product [Caenorhabditis angaria]